MSSRTLRMTVLFGLIAVVSSIPALGFVTAAPVAVPDAAIPVAYRGQSETWTITSDTILTEDHSGNIVIGKDSVRLDCAGHAILGDRSGAGLTLVGRTGVDVRNCVITGADVGIELVGSSGNHFMLNEITNNRVGVRVESLGNRPSQGNEFGGNQVNNNDEEGFAVRASHENFFDANVVEANGRDGFDLNGSHNNAILANRVTLNGFNGIELDSSNNNVLNNNFSNQNGHLGNRSGFSLDDSDMNVFTANFAHENRRNGYRFDNSDGNIFQNNSACGNGAEAVIPVIFTGDFPCEPIEVTEVTVEPSSLTLTARPSRPTASRNIRIRNSLAVAKRITVGPVQVIDDGSLPGGGPLGTFDQDNQSVTFTLPAGGERLFEVSFTGEVFNGPGAFQTARALLPISFDGGGTTVRLFGVVEQEFE